MSLYNMLLADYAPILPPQVPNFIESRGRPTAENVHEIATSQTQESILSASDKAEYRL